MPIELSSIPAELTCSCCGAVVMSNIPKFQRFEVLVAQAIAGEIAPAGTPGFDVCNSRRYPGLTFQVKVSNPGKPKTYTKRGRTYRSEPQWAWSSRDDAALADWYVLFGILDEMAYPFLLSRSEWLAHGAKSNRQHDGETGKYILFQIPTNRMSISPPMGKGGGHIRMNVGWRFELQDWPGSLHRRIEAYQELSQPLLLPMALSASSVGQSSKES